MSWIKKLLLALFMPLIAVAFTLFILELFLIYENSYTQPKIKEIELYGYKYPFIDRDGLDLFKKNKTDKHNVFIVGDSFAQGLTCAADNQDFPGHLQQSLGSQYRVINLAIEGMNPVDYLDWLSQISINKGDEVVIVLYDNDTHISQRNCMQISRQSLSYDLYVPEFCKPGAGIMIEKNRSSRLKRLNNKLIKFKVFKLMKEGLLNIPSFAGLFYRAESQALWNNYEAEETKWLVSSLVVIEKFILSKEAKAYFTYYPNTNLISENDPRHKIWKNFKLELNSATGIKLYDPYPYFIKKSPNKSMVWSLTDKHPSCDGYSMMSDYITLDVIDAP